MKTNLLTDLSDKQQEGVTGGELFSELAKEALEEFDKAQKLIAKLRSDTFPPELDNAIDEVHDSMKG